MEGFASLLALVALVAAWWLAAKKLKGKNWFLRHLTGSTVGVVALIAVMLFFVATGLVDPEDSTSPIAADAREEDLAPEIVLPVKTDALPEPSNQAAETELASPAEPEPEPEPEPVEDTFAPESQAILDEFTPRMAALVGAGMSMESARNNDLGQCGDMMRQNQAELSALREELSAAYKALPAGQGAWHPSFEPLHNASANLPRCVTCLPTALPDCKEAAHALAIKE
ncbi:hypothetical protein SAMN05216198_2063 [Halopseudomonas litoralis]|uniref:Uncharacterized protein n=1 Tax=Halopseudomonas litoralis TaxID=797277 RepID=A0A1H1SLI2_9GAMM|nr:hypothetical protein [Halopseudomonas litoralis]SDS48781.1 hypothetical protein SAMN05216198_2063 [Halopseudomonas litoralis]